MAKRVSLKGKGADLFFGEYIPSPAQESPADIPTGPDADLVKHELPLTDELVSENSAALQTPAVIEVSRRTPALSSPPLSPAATPPPVATKATPRSTSTKQARQLASLQASPSVSELASVLASNQEDTVTAIRKVVRTPGKEVSFTRLTVDEKEQLSDLIYERKKQGQKTTENEINRIAINYLLLDYREHGEESVLARVLAALHA